MTDDEQLSAITIARIGLRHVKHCITRANAFESGACPVSVGMSVTDAHVIEQYLLALESQNLTPAARVRDIIRRVNGSGETLGGALSDVEIGALEFCAAAESLERKAT